MDDVVLGLCGPQCDENHNKVLTESFSVPPTSKYSFLGNTWQWIDQDAYFNL